VLVRRQQGSLVPELWKQGAKPVRYLVNDFGNALTQASAHFGAGVAERHPSGHRRAEGNPLIHRTHQQGGLPEPRNTGDHDLVAIDDGLGRQMVHGS